MVFALAIIAAFAATQASSTLSDVAIACRDPSDIAQTKLNVQNRGWSYASTEKQSIFDREISVAQHPEDKLAVTMSVFEKSDIPNLLLIVGEEREADGFWMRSCILRDPAKQAVTDLASVKAAFSLGTHEYDEAGPAYLWELWDANLTYTLYLDPKDDGVNGLIIQKYGRD